MAQPLPPIGSVLGVDVGCSESRHSSAVCRLDWTESEINWSIRRFRAIEPERTETIVEAMGKGMLLAAAFDGPLRRTFDVIGRYRAAERMLTRRLGRYIGKPGQSSSPVGRSLNAHANYCVAAVLMHGKLTPAHHSVSIHDCAVAEAFPTSFLGVMIERPSALTAVRGNRSDIYYQHLAESSAIHRLMKHYLPDRHLASHPQVVSNHDDRVAFVCALSALCIAKNDYVAVGDDDGWIILPPKQFIRPWALELLDLNNSKEKRAALVVASS